jgi:hypothetical protein
LLQKDPPLAGFSFWETGALPVSVAIPCVTKSGSVAISNVPVNDA